MNFVQFKPEDKIEIVLNGLVTDCAVVVACGDGDHTNNADRFVTPVVLVVSTARDARETPDAYLYFPAGDIFECGSDRKVGSVDAGWRLLTRSPEAPHKMQFDPFSTVYELRLAQSSN